MLLVSTIINGLNFGFNVTILQALYCILTYYVAINVAYFIKLTYYDKVLTIITKIFISSIIIKSIFYFQELSIVYATNQATLALPFWFVGGGHNLEVTYMLFLTIFFIRRKVTFYIIFTIVTIFSIIYMSRVGMIESIILLFFKLTMNMSKKKILYFATIFILLLLILSINFDDSIFFDRFINISDELKDSKAGRGMLWSAAFQLLQSNLNGYGIGNSILMAKDLLQKNFIENNFHNIYLQYLLDLGILPLIAYIYLVVKRAINSTIKEFKIFFVIFTTISVVQFSGYDVVFWFFLGLYDAIARVKVLLQIKEQKGVLIEKYTS